MWPAPARSLNLRTFDKNAVNGPPRQLRAILQVCEQIGKLDVAFIQHIGCGAWRKSFLFPKGRRILGSGSRRFMRRQ